MTEMLEHLKVIRYCNRHRNKHWNRCWNKSELEITHLGFWIPYACYGIQMYVLVKLCVSVCVRASENISIVMTERSGPTEITQREKQKEKETEKDRDNQKNI